MKSSFSSDRRLRRNQELKKTEKKQFDYISCSAIFRSIWTAKRNQKGCFLDGITGFRIGQ